VDILQAVEAYTEGEDPNVVITGYRRILNKLKIGLYSAEILNADLFLVRYSHIPTTSRLNKFARSTESTFFGDVDGW